MSDDLKKAGQTPKQIPPPNKKPIDLPPLRERTEQASNKGEARRPVMATPIPPPPKKQN